MSKKYTDQLVIGDCGADGLTPSVLDDQRAEHLEKALNEINEANKRVGATYMSDSHPKAGAIDAKYARGGQIGRDLIGRNHETHNKRAWEHFLMACGSCALAGCEIRHDYGAFKEKYYTSPARKSFAEKLEKNSSTPC
jgi:hypothetical protein